MGGFPLPISRSFCPNYPPTASARKKVLHVLKFSWCSRTFGALEVLRIPGVLNVGAGHNICTSSTRKHDLICFMVMQQAAENTNEKHGKQSISWACSMNDVRRGICGSTRIRSNYASTIARALPSMISHSLFATSKSPFPAASNWKPSTVAPSRPPAHPAGEAPPRGSSHPAMISPSVS